MTERAVYSSTLLVGKDPYESTEAVRIRLSEAKLINKNFFVALKEISDLQTSYNQRLRKIITQNENLGNILSKQLLTSQILTEEESRKYTFNSIGEVQQLWDVLIQGLKDNLDAHTQLQLVLQHDVISVLKNNTETDSNWAETRKLHSRLSQAASVIDYYNNTPNASGNPQEAMDQWGSESPYLFDTFEKVDFDRLQTLKNCLLKYQTSYSDYFLSSTKNCENGMATLLSFDPETEINRFADEAMKFNFKMSDPKALNSTKQKAYAQEASPSKKEKRRSTFGNISHRLTSNSTVLHHDLMNDEFSDSNNNVSLKSKKSGSLKSKVGSIFGRNKLKNKKSQNLGGLKEASIPEQASSGSSIRTPSRTSTRNPVPRPSDTQPPLPREQYEKYQAAENSTPSNNYTPPANTYEAPTNNYTAVSNSSDWQQEHLPSNQQVNTPPTSPAEVPSHTQEKETQNFNEKPLPEEPTPQNSPSVSSRPLHIQAPSIPPSRKQNRDSVLGNDPFASEVLPHEEVSAPNVADSNRVSVLLSQVTPGLQALDPQTTGTSTTISGQSIFQHESAGEIKSGLNASVAEVINARFRDGILESSQLVGELALVYAKDPAQELPIGVNLKIENGDKFEKVILNQAFMEKVSPEEYKVNPIFINSRTLGAIKYSISNPVVPIIIQPVWKFEAHQASVILTVKMSPTISNTIQSVTLNDFSVHVTIDGAETTNALSKPQGSFNKDKKRISWKFKQPLVLTRQNEERLIARFMTEGTAYQTSKSVLTKFTILKSGEFGGSLNLFSQESNEENPFGGAWEVIEATKTLTAGNYIGLST
ncbi:hypothetical protein TPHA_0E03470 [Tetrapisispora phaffii CBS 4417]|uniref:MHD domain-containing protein n=1 Tax=Tetrapisispora phaffii (strain ATCC 24235 / CBS 4417 / NBRC 1672 / NRRL Y-8282 / UCD 70-5) TaxID=1071381 RepID=G8BU59_TETPH|nr:hypothetical protein TPHA_0E03470 [Tetrapisispora phaffii CBS 4417]CCE63437.1 hypothetical protein TPHA_0E03470 [Tetrapisispora phaffii CBS 4417]